MKSALFLLISIFTLSSCKKDVDLSKSKKKLEEHHHLNETGNTNRFKNIQTSFTLDNFNETFEDINGPTCVFAETDKNYENRQFLFASNFDSIGYV